MQGPFSCAHSFETKADRADDKAVRGREGRQPMGSREQTPFGAGEGGAEVTALIKAVTGVRG